MFTEFPTETPLRIAYFTIYVSALVVYAAYSASLTSFLTVTSASLPFSTLEGFSEDGSYKLIVYQNSSDWDLLSVSYLCLVIHLIHIQLYDLTFSCHTGVVPSVIGARSVAAKG